MFVPVNETSMDMMDHEALREEAQNCRREALTYLGRREASFLVSAAKAFEELAEADRRIQVRQPDHA